MDKETLKIAREMISDAYKDLVKANKSKKWDDVVYNVGYLNGLCVLIDKDELNLWIYNRFLIRNKWRKETTNATSSIL